MAGSICTDGRAAGAGHPSVSRPEAVALPASGVWGSRRGRWPGLWSLTFVRMTGVVVFSRVILMTVRTQGCEGWRCWALGPDFRQDDAGGLVTFITSRRHPDEGQDPEPRALRVVAGVSTFVGMTGGDDRRVGLRPAWRRSGWCGRHSPEGLGEGRALPPGRTRGRLPCGNRPLPSIRYARELGNWGTGELGNWGTGGTGRLRRG